MARRLALLIALLYPVAAIGVFAATIRTDNFAIFREGYQFAWLLLVPALLILLTISLAFMKNAPSRRIRYGMMVWIGVVTWAHYTIIGIAAASV